MIIEYFYIMFYYLQDTLTCTTDMTCDRTYVSDYRYVGGYYGGCNEELMMESLITEGPMAVAFEVTDEFHSYADGVFVQPTSSKADFDPMVVSLSSMKLNQVYSEL